MIVKGKVTPDERGRCPYTLGKSLVAVHHFVTRVTTPHNPFKPHKHEQPELWFILEGDAVVTLDGAEHTVEAEDLIVIEPWVEHGLRTERQVKWICLG